MEKGGILINRAFRIWHTGPRARLIDYAEPRQLTQMEIDKRDKGYPVGSGVYRAHRLDLSTNARMAQLLGKKGA